MRLTNHALISIIISLATESEAAGMKHSTETLIHLSWHTVAMLRCAAAATVVPAQLLGLESRTTVNYESTMATAPDTLPGRWKPLQTPKKLEVASSNLVN